MGDDMTRGIYGIRNTLNGRIYVGSSIHIEARWQTHRARLRRGTHHADKLQQEWNTFGAEAFEFVVLEALPNLDDTLPKAEQRWINELNAFCSGYNSRPKAESCAGYRRPPFSAEHCRRISEAKRGANNPNYGKARPEDTRKKIAESNKGKSRTVDTKARVSESRIRRGDPRFAEVSRRIGQTAVATRERRGLERLEQTRPDVEAAIKALGRITPARWNAYVGQHPECGLCRASRRVGLGDYVIYGIPWAVFLRTLGLASPS